MNPLFIGMAVIGAIALGFTANTVMMVSHVGPYARKEENQQPNTKNDTSNNDERPDTNLPLAKDNGTAFNGNGGRKRKSKRRKSIKRKTKTKRR